MVMAKAKAMVMILARVVFLAIFLSMGMALGMEIASGDIDNILQLLLLTFLCFKVYGLWFMAYDDDNSNTDIK